MVQPMLPTVSAAPASTRATSRSSTSISGMNASPPKKAPASRPRDQDDRGQPPAQPAEARRHQPRQPDAERREAGRQQAEGDPVEALTGGLQRRGPKRRPARRPSIDGGSRRPGRPPADVVRIMLAQRRQHEQAADQRPAGRRRRTPSASSGCWVSQADTGGPTKDGTTQAVEM